jgi:hypothetical protein
MLSEQLIAIIFSVVYTSFLKCLSHCTVICNQGYFPAENEDSECNKRPRPESPTIVEEENLIRERLKGAFADSDDDSGGEIWGGLFQKRHKTQAEVVCIAVQGTYTIRCTVGVQLQPAFSSQ